MTMLTDIFASSWMGICLSVQLVIAVFAFCKMRNACNLSRELEFIFYFSFLCASSTTVASALLIWKNEERLFWCIFYVSYTYFFLSLLVTFVLRLHLAFKGSAFEMTKNTKLILVIMLSVEFVLGIYFIVENILSVFEYLIPRFVTDSATYLFLVLYFVAASISVHSSVSNLYRVAKLEQRYGSNESAANMALSKRQQKWINLSAKYISLFFIAFLSTILSLFLFIMFANTERNVISVVPADQTMNLLCIFLKFVFAKQQYRRYCCCADSCCTAMVSKCVNRDIGRTLLQREDQPTPNIVLSDDVSDVGRND